MLLSMHEESKPLLITCQGGVSPAGCNAWREHVIPTSSFPHHQVPWQYMSIDQDYYMFSQDTYGEKIFSEVVLQTYSNTVYIFLIIWSD